MIYNTIKTFITDDSKSTIINAYLDTQYWGQDGMYWDKDFTLFIEPVNIGSQGYLRVTLTKCV